MNASTSVLERSVGTPTVAPTRTSEPAQGRFTLVDGLRALAAISVMLHHLLYYTQLQGALRQSLPVPLQIWCEWGSFGVQIFFVLSGFVIAHSLTNFKPGLQSAAAFIAKRQIRLDPPYWAAILLVLFVDRVMRFALHFQPKPMPSFGWIAANALYIYKFVGDPHALGIVAPAWTLCLEIQFYVFFITLLTFGFWCSSKLLRSLSEAGRVTIWLVALTGALSLAVTPCAYADQNSPVFFDNWYYFACGALCYWSGRRQRSAAFFVSFAALFLLGALIHQDRGMYVGFCTAVVLFAGARLSFLQTGLNWPWVQHLGRISYSVYLVHAIVGPTVLRLGYKLTHEDPLFAALWFVLAFAASLGVAELLYRLIEKPSMRLSSRINVMSFGRPRSVSNESAERTSALSAKAFTTRPQ